MLPEDQSNHLNVFLPVEKGISEYETIRHFYSVLKKQSLSFPRYEIACCHLFKLTGYAKYKIDQPASSVDKIADALVDASGIILDIVPLAEILTSLLSKLVSLSGKKISGAVLSTIREGQEKRLSSFICDLARMTRSEIERQLTAFWILDLNQAMAGLHTLTEEIGDSPYHLVFAIDSFEQRYERNSEDWFLERIIPNIERATWFIFSTESKIDIPVTDMQLYPFSSDDCLNYLKQRGIDDPAVQKRILHCSDGLPASIQILIDIYEKNQHYFDQSAERKGYDELFKTYFRKHLSQEEQYYLKYLVHFPNWNYSIFKYVVGNDPKNNPNGKFDALIRKTALISKVRTDSPEGSTFCLIGIVEKALRALLEENSGDPDLIGTQKCRFQYYRDESDNIIFQLSSLPKDKISYKTYASLKNNLQMAFDAAVCAYSDSREFDEYSRWCLVQEQFLSKVALFELKAALTQYYLEQVQKKDQFRFDSDQDENKRFRFRFRRDQVWAHHMLGNGKRAIQIASQYFCDLVETYGIPYQRIPFSLYLLGLVYRDAGDMESARWFLSQSIQLGLV